jgi:hypothetical protein
MTRNSPVSLVGSSFNPSCSWIAVKIDVPRQVQVAWLPCPRSGVVGRVLRDSQVFRQ